MSAIILAGGRSSRLGQDKTKLVLGGTGLLRLTIDRLRQLGGDIILVLAPDQAIPLGSDSADVRVATDLHPNKGPLAGLYSGMMTSEDDICVAVGCDMPFLNVKLLGYMNGLASGFDIVIPRADGMVEPLHAVYSKSCLPVMDRMMSEGDMRVRNLLRRVNVRYVEGGELDEFDPLHRSWFNINTPEDLREAEEIIATHGVR